MAAPTPISTSTSTSPFGKQHLFKHLPLTSAVHLAPAVATSNNCQENVSSSLMPQDGRTLSKDVKKVCDGSNKLYVCKENLYENEDGSFLIVGDFHDTRCILTVETEKAITKFISQKKNSGEKFKILIEQGYGLLKSHFKIFDSLSGIKPPKAKDIGNKFMQIIWLSVNTSPPEDLIYVDNRHDPGECASKNVCLCNYDTAIKTRNFIREWHGGLLRELGRKELELGVNYIAPARGLLGRLKDILYRIYGMDIDDDVGVDVGVDVDVDVDDDSDNHFIHRYARLFVQYKKHIHSPWEYLEDAFFHDQHRTKHASDIRLFLIDNYRMDLALVYHIFESYFRPRLGLELNKKKKNPHDPPLDPPAILVFLGDWHARLVYITLSYIGENSYRALEELDRAPGIASQ